MSDKIFEQDVFDVDGDAIKVWVDHIQRRNGKPTVILGIPEHIRAVRLDLPRLRDLIDALTDAAVVLDMSPRQLALAKLTEEDKKVLGLL